MISHTSTSSSIYTHITQHILHQKYETLSQYSIITFPFFTLVPNSLSDISYIAKWCKNPPILCILSFTVSSIVINLSLNNLSTIHLQNISSFKQPTVYSTSFSHNSYFSSIQQQQQQSPYQKSHPFFRKYLH